MDRLGKASSVDACVAGGKLYLAAANNSNAATAMLTYDGQQWNENILTDIQSKDVVRLVVKDRIPYVFWTSGNEKTLQAAYLKDDSWQKLASTIGTDINGFDIFAEQYVVCCRSYNQWYCFCEDNEDGGRNPGSACDRA